MVQQSDLIPAKRNGGREKKKKDPRELVPRVIQRSVHNSTTRTCNIMISVSS